MVENKSVPTARTTHRACCGRNRGYVSLESRPVYYASSGRNTEMKTFFSFIIVLVLIAVPAYILTKYPQYYNQLAQVLFDILLFGASIWFASSIDTKKAEKAATGKWLPRAEGSCNELLAMRANIESMHAKQANTCESIERIFPGIAEKQLAPVVNFMKTRCAECAGNFKDLGNHLDNSVKGWETFIEDNCEANECQRIIARLNKTRQTLGLSTETSSSSPITQSQDNTPGNKHVGQGSMSSDR